MDAIYILKNIPHLINEFSYILTTTYHITDKESLKIADIIFQQPNVRSILLVELEKLKQQEL